MIRTTILVAALSVGPALAQDAPVGDPAAAKEMLRETFGWRCIEAMDGRFADEEPDIFTIDVRADYEDAPLETFTLYRLSCGAGAYNLIDLWLVAAPDGPPEPAAFPVPLAEPVYADEASEVLERIDVTGFTAEPTLVNSSYDPETRTITSYSKWRGIGDAYESGTWRFDYGRFVLTDYEVDPTFDGEQTPVTVFPTD